MILGLANVGTEVQSGLHRSFDHCVSLAHVTTTQPCEKLVGSTPHNEQDCQNLRKNGLTSIQISRFRDGRARLSSHRYYHQNHLSRQGRKCKSFHIGDRFAISLATCKKIIELLLTLPTNSRKLKSNGGFYQPIRWKCLAHGETWRLAPRTRQIGTRMTGLPSKLE